MASNDIVLGSALRTNLLSLQSTQRQIDITQLRLATGKKVNSALDNPQNFFTSQALSNRASDLTRLLDGIGQSIQTIVEADKGVTALTSLVEQADSIVSSARDELAASEGEARVVGNVDLRNINNLVGLGGITTNDVIRIVTTNDAGSQIAQNISIVTGDTAFTLAAKITDAFADNLGGEITANVNSATGFLEIQSSNGRAFKIGDTTPVGATNVTLAGYTALGIGRYFEDETRGTATLAQATIIPGNTVSSISLYEAAGNLVDAGDQIQGSTFTNAAGTTVVSGITTGATLNFLVNSSTGTASGTIALSGTTTFQDVVDQINLTPAINTLVRAEFNSETGSLELTSLSDSVENLGITLVTTSAAGTAFNLGFGGNGNLDGFTTNAAGTVAAGTYETILGFNTSTQALDQFAADFNTVREQINDLVNDANYRGVNLLRGDNLTTFFNEDNTSSLVTNGAVFTSDGLGLIEANFRSAGAIETFSELTRDALNEVRSFGSSLANNLSIIQTRQTFTQETINTLKAGSALLTDADPNEEGANLLALQTRQQLGVTALSLASQSQQSVLRLF